MLTIYLAGPYAARDTLANYAAELRDVGYRVQCRWLDETHDITPGTLGAATDLDDTTANGHAYDDLADIDRADVLVAFTGAAAGVTNAGSGGRHVETGYALALNKHVVVVGEPENVFHRLRQVERHPDWHAALIALAGRLVAHTQCAPRAVEGVTA